MDAVQHLSIDIETYSDISLPKAGLYRYAQSPAFEVLLIAYSIDGGPVQVVDLANGEEVPFFLYSALFMPHVIKHAFNAAFEWYCLSKAFHLTEEQAMNWLPQWRCTMIHALYCGYPASLKAAGGAQAIIRNWPLGTRSSSIFASRVRQHGAMDTVPEICRNMTRRSGICSKPTTPRM